MYSCGPTVYHYAHIGNLRTFTFQDILRRYLRRCGWKLLHVMNITDVDDKIIKNAGEKGLSLTDYTRKYEKAFFEDAAGLRLEKPEKIARATEHIDAMLRLVERIAEKGHTYRSGGSTYFKIASWNDYGKLSRLDAKGIRAGARVDQDEYEKDDARDFALWKACREDEPHWPGPFGAGRPGWHLECSAMAMQYLGETFDIHTGGVDCSFRITRTRSRSRKPRRDRQAVRALLDPCRAPAGRRTEDVEVARQFLYAARSAGARFFRRGGALPAVFDSAPQAVELHVGRLERRRGGDRPPAELQAPYRRRRFCGCRLAADERAGRRRPRTIFRGARRRLNTAQALGAVFEYIREANSAIDGGTFGQENAAEAGRLLELFDSIFDVLEPPREGRLPAEAVESRIADRARALRCPRLRSSGPHSQRTRRSGA